MRGRKGRGERLTDGAQPGHIRLNRSVVVLPSIAHPEKQLHVRAHRCAWGVVGNMVIKPGDVCLQPLRKKSEEVSETSV